MALLNYGKKKEAVSLNGAVFLPCCFPAKNKQTPHFRSTFLFSDPVNNLTIKTRINKKAGLNL
jgi:hypothetical protein